MFSFFLLSMFPHVLSLHFKITFLLVDFQERQRKVAQTYSD